MPLEQKSEQFNKEALRSSLFNALKNYTDIANNIRHCHHEDEERATQQKKLLEKWDNNFTNEMVVALKLAKDKQEILDLFSEVFSDTRSEESQLYDENDVISKTVELNFLKDIIIKLLE
ncbi:MAG TPA: hypothetical protein VJY62_09120 [Bacteroidia bacterium]|nr:hypothetical protein [Bacteroidia bacterium]